MVGDGDYVGGNVERFRARSGRYFIYDVSQSILNKGEVSPNHRNDCLYFRAQFYVRGAWRYAKFRR